MLIMWTYTQAQQESNEHYWSISFCAKDERTSLDRKSVHCFNYRSNFWMKLKFPGDILFLANGSSTIACCGGLFMIENLGTIISSVTKMKGQTLKKS